MVQARYALHHDRLSFDLGDYDRGQRLVIDPALIFATYITSNCSACIDTISDIAADNTGVYLTGSYRRSDFSSHGEWTHPNSDAKQSDLHCEARSNRLNGSLLRFSEQQCRTGDRSG